MSQVDCLEVLKKGKWLTRDEIVRSLRERISMAAVCNNLHGLVKAGFVERRWKNDAPHGVTAVYKVKK